MLLKCFGVTRHGRVIFYDYDELCQVTDCRFREMPSARNDDEERHSGAWFYVGENDIFPEQFVQYLGPRPLLRQVLLDQHGELFTAQCWLQLQQALRDGEVFEISPYRDEVRLGHPHDADVRQPFSFTGNE